MSVPAISNGATSLLAELEKAGAVVNNGLFLPPDLPYDQYEAVGTMLGLLHRTNCWLIGDWLNFGEHVYGEKHAQASVLLGLSPQTCTNYASIARRVPPSRRVATLSFSIHAEVAALPAEEQKQFLQVAEAEGLTKMELRARIKPEVPPAVEITCPHCGETFEPPSFHR